MDDTARGTDGDPAGSGDAGTGDAAGDTGNDVACSIPSDPEGAIEPRFDAADYEQHFVSTDGGDDAAGTREDPWSVDAANDRAEPGDVVGFLPGTYEETIAPPSGTPEERVIFRSSERHQAVLQRQYGNVHNIGLDDTSHATVQGFRVRAGISRMAYMVNSEDVRIRDVVFDGGVMDGSGGMPIDVEDSTNVDFINNVVRRSRKGDLMKVTNSDRIRIIGNTFAMAPHKPLNVKNADRVVVRANVLHNPIGGHGAVFFGEKNLVEGNVWTNGFDGPGSNGAGDIMFAEHMIYRFNRSYHNWGVHHVIHTFEESMRATNSRYVHNVHHDTASYGQRGGQAWHMGGGSQVEDLVFKNNVYLDVGQRHDFQQLWTDDIGSGSAQFVQNFVGASGEATPTIEYDRTTYEASRVEEEFDTFRDNLVDRPEPFVEPDSYNHVPRPDGPLVDTGAALTRTTDAGSGAVVTVEDPYYFYDGWDIPREAGDLIQIGDDVARVEGIDYETGEMQLDSSIAWESGEPVAMPWAGEGPDLGPHERMGAYEITIEQTDPSTSAGESVGFRARLSGPHCPEQICWQFGDGEGACGREVEHVYDDPGSYGVRLRAVDSEGRATWRAAQVLVDGEGIDVDSVEYNKQLIDSFLCDGEDYPSTPEGATELVQGEDGDWHCR